MLNPVKRIVMNNMIVLWAALFIGVSVWHVECKKKKGTKSLKHCVGLKRVYGYGDNKVRLTIRLKLALSELYYGHGICNRILHTDSIRLNSVCHGINVHAENFEQAKRCRLKHRNEKSVSYKKCRWNERNTHTSFVMPLQNVKVGQVVKIGFYNKANCRNWTGAVIIAVRPYSHR